MTTLWDLPDFDNPRLAVAVEALTEEASDRLPFGAIRLDANGVVAFYNAAERKLSGSGDLQRLGLDFFKRIAPCLDNPAYRGRIERARAAGRLDMEFIHIGDFEDRERELSVRIQSAADAGYWIFMRRN